MKTLLVLIAVGALVGAAQVSLTNAGGPENDTQEDLLKFLNTKMLTLDEMVPVMSGTQHKGLVVCKGHTIAELLELYNISIRKCSKEALKQANALCEDLLVARSSTDANACDNARHYCRQIFEERAEFCIARKSEVVRGRIAESAFIEPLEQAIKLTKLQHANGDKLDYELLIRRSYLELFITRGVTDSRDVRANNRISDSLVYFEATVANLSKDEVLKRCNARQLQPYAMAHLLSSSKDKNAAVCDRHFVAELLELNHLSIRKCSGASLKAHSEICDDLVAGSSYACDNARNYCRQSLVEVAEFCIDYVNDVVENKITSPEFIESIREMIDQAKQQDKEEVGLAYDMGLKKSNLEMFLATGNSKSGASESAKWNPRNRR